MKIRDRAGREWQFENYTSPSGPAFCLTIPDELVHEAFGNYTVHFDGSMEVTTDE